MLQSRDMQISGLDPVDIWDAIGTFDYTDWASVQTENGM